MTVVWTDTMLDACFFAVFIHCAVAHFPVSSPQHDFQSSDVSSRISDREVLRTQLFNRAI